MHLSSVFLELDDCWVEVQHSFSGGARPHCYHAFSIRCREVGSFPHRDLSKISDFFSVHKKPIGDCGNVPIRHPHLVKLIMERFLCRNNCGQGLVYFTQLAAQALTEKTGSMHWGCAELVLPWFGLFTQMQ
jgi:hypothetical protein